MATITPNLVHVNKPLTQISVAYMQEDPAIADVVFPTISVEKQSDLYYIYSLADFNRDTMEKRAPSTESVGDSWRLSDDTYYCDSYAIHVDIPVELRANEDSPLAVDQDAVAFLSMKMKLKKNILWASEYFAAGVWTGGTAADPTPGTKWDAANATPITDLREQIRSVKDKTGFRPNTLVLGGAVWDALLDSADFLGRLSTSERQIVTREHLAKVLELERILVGDMMKVTSNEGAATTTTAPVFTDNALLLHVARKPGKRTPTAGYQFRWTARELGGTGIRKFHMELKRADRLEVQDYWDNKVIDPNMGCLLDDVLT